MAKIPIAAMAANVFREDIETCVEAGSSEHTGQPLDMDEVAERLRQFLGDV